MSFALTLSGIALASLAAATTNEITIIIDGN